jgi:hypothetical protein
MNIPHFLNQHRFAGYQEFIGVVFPKRIFVIRVFRLQLQLAQGSLGAMPFQMIDNAAGRDPVQKSQRIRRASFAVSHDVKMIGHYRIPEIKHAGRGASLNQRFTKKFFVSIRAENRKPVVCDRCEKVKRSVERWSGHSFGGLASEESYGHLPERQAFPLIIRASPENIIMASPKRSFQE